MAKNDNGAGIGTMPSLETAKEFYPVLMQHWAAYCNDAFQRQILVLDVLRQRGNISLEHKKQGRPPVLVYDFETIVEGKSLPRPVNYSLVRIIPDDPNIQIDDTKRPYVVVDPRAGHGPGIGGSKKDSQIGVSLRGGHPTYFVMFHPTPEPGQTLVDVTRAEAAFMAEVAKRHPNAPKPCVVGNCQAGWAITMLAAVSPENMGAIILNGAPLSYWAGVDGKNPMRYLGGLNGGSWIASLMSDLGNGQFDGAHLVSNFENLNPANTLWNKQYSLYSRVDTEAERYLNFEKWWNGFFLMNEEEIEFIVDNLFIGNRLGSGDIHLDENTVVDLKNIPVPIIVFASAGDNITPPQQALNWIIDVYGSDEEIVKNNQTIVYMLHQNIGHLGIFVSGAVAQKEHKELIDTLEFIDLMPPGLYEMVIVNKDELSLDDPMAPGKYLVRFEERSIKDIEALDDGREEEAYFSSLAAMSERNSAFYKTAIRPFIKPLVNEQTAELMRELHPARIQRYLFSDANPFMRLVEVAAEQVRQQRKKVSADNPFLLLEKDIAEAIGDSLDSYRVRRDNRAQILFKMIYGPTGLGQVFPPQQKEQSVDSRHTADEILKTLLPKLEVEDFDAAVTRMAILISRADRVIERRQFVRSESVRPQHPKLLPKTNAELKQQLREQFALLYFAKDQAIAALPKMLPTPEDRQEALDIAIQVVTGGTPNRAELAVIADLKQHLELA